MSPLDKQFTLDYFRKMLKRKKGNIKASLLDKEIEALFKSMQAMLKESIKLGGLAYEKDFYGNKGKYGSDQFKIGYKEGKPCPNCHTTIQKIKTGSTSTFICPKCQPLSK